MTYPTRWLLVLTSFACAPWRAHAAPPTAVDLRVEGLSSATQIDTASPRFSWRVNAPDARDVQQTAYQLRVTEIAADGKNAAAPLETPRIASSDSQFVSVADFTAKPRSRYAWQVRVWDNHDGVSAWSDAQTFDTGLIGGSWPADWIGDGRMVAQGETRGARYFRNTFQLDRAPARARLFVSAMGLVDPWVNGEPVTADRFVPGWPDYRHRVFYVAYDVTSHLRAGDNAWGAMLADGWYSGTILPLHQYGNEPKFSAFLEVTDADGKTTTLTTGKDWKWADGAITDTSIYNGETFDARRADPSWSAPTIAGAAKSWTWNDVSVRPARRVYQTYTARLAPPVRTHERIKPVSRKEVKPGVFVYDLGQNIVGWAQLRVEAPAGTAVKIRFAEMLDKDGSIYTANLRAAKATALYTTKGSGLETWEPRFTYFGFRYLELTGVTAPHDDAIEGVVVHADLARTGNFTCSDPLLNKLYENTLWGQKGNFLEVPTDCPQRDERLGWTGDAQIFCNTALYNMDAGRFYAQWLYAVRDSFHDGSDGGFCDVAPTTGFGFGSAGWGDAGVIIPYIAWLHTGDRRILQDSMPSIQHWIELQLAQAPDGIRISRPSYGDWLSPGYPLREAPPSYELIATAYFARTADIAARIAAVLEEPGLALRDRTIFRKARNAFAAKYISPDGKIEGDVQTSYLLALAFELVPDELHDKVVANLLRTIAEKNNHLATGFLGTPLLTPTLTSLGRADLAYTILEQQTYPGWLFSVKNGATTIWERWDSWTPEVGFHPDGMNSFNHYAYGSVIEWFYDTIAGLKPDPRAPGWKKFRIAPTPGGGLTFAKAELETPYGRAVSDWKIDGGTMRLTVRIPENTSAEIALPAKAPDGVKLDGAALKDAQTRDGRVVFTLPSGEYAIELPFAQ